MGVRVKARLINLESKKEVTTAALLNAGFETTSPTCLIPVRLAEELDMWPELPKGTRVKSYETAGGPVKMYSIANAIKVCVIVSNKEISSVVCDAVISEIEREVLISDMAIEALNLIIEAPGSGLWRFAGSSEIYKSEKPEYW